MRLIHPRWCAGVKGRFVDIAIVPGHVVEQRDLVNPDQSDGKQRCLTCERESVRLGFVVMNQQCDGIVRSVVNQQCDRIVRAMTAYA